MNETKKEIILGFLILLFSVLSWYFLKYIFYINNMTTTYWILGSVALIFWGISLCLGMLLIKNQTIMNISMIASLIGFVMFFNNEPFYYFVGLILIFIVFRIVVFKIKKEQEIQVNLNFWKIWKRGFPLLITVFLLMVALIYYFSPNLIEFKKGETEIPRKVFDVIIQPLEGLIVKKLPSEAIDLDSEVINILTYEQIEELEQNYKVEINERESIKDFIYKLTNREINKETDSYKKFIPIGLAVGLFLGLKIVSVIYVALVMLLSWLVLKILIAVKFVKIEIETKEVETVKL